MEKKIKIIFKILFLFQFLISICYSNEYKLYDNNNSEFYVYIFLNENSCMTCQDYTYSFINKYKDNNNLEIRIFYNGVTEDFYNEHIKNKFLINTTFDNLGLYSDYYKINNYPGLIILSKSGKEILNSDFLDDKLKIDNLNISKEYTILISDLEGNFYEYGSTDFVNNTLSISLSNFGNFFILKIITENETKTLKYFNTNKEVRK